jgi:hypothetical protein
LKHFLTIWLEVGISYQYGPFLYSVDGGLSGCLGMFCAGQFVWRGERTAWTERICKSALTLAFLSGAEARLSDLFAAERTNSSACAQAFKWWLKE